MTEREGHTKGMVLCGGEIIPSTLRELCGQTNDKIDIRQINRRTISYVQDSQRRETYRQSDN